MHTVSSRMAIFQFMDVKKSRDRRPHSILRESLHMPPPPSGPHSGPGLKALRPMPTRYRNRLGTRGQRPFRARCAEGTAQLSTAISHSGPPQREGGREAYAGCALGVATTEGSSVHRRPAAVHKVRSPLRPFLPLAWGGVPRLAPRSSPAFFTASWSLAFLLCVGFPGLFEWPALRSRLPCCHCS